jgi:hypothetical protein
LTAPRPLAIFFFGSPALSLVALWLGLLCRGQWGPGLPPPPPSLSSPPSASIFLNPPPPPFRSSKFLARFNPERITRIKILLFSCVWLVVFGSGVAYCVSSWMLSHANTRLSSIRQRWSACVGAAECASISAEATSTLKYVVEYLRVCLHHFALLVSYRQPVLFYYRQPVLFYCKRPTPRALASHHVPHRPNLRAITHPQISQSIDAFVYFATCVVYTVGVVLFLLTVALVLVSIRRESSVDSDRQSQNARFMQRSSAQLLRHLSLQFSLFVSVVLLCFLFRAG